MGQRAVAAALEWLDRLGRSTLHLVILGAELRARVGLRGVQSGPASALLISSSP
ncbi:MAG: hypothetical protein ACRDR6_25000 [Pseudonocardiaceae bacterium]